MRAGNRKACCAFVLTLAILISWTVFAQAQSVEFTGTVERKVTFGIIPTFLVRIEQVAPLSPNVVLAGKKALIFNLASRSQCNDSGQARFDKLFRGDEVQVIGRLVATGSLYGVWISCHPDSVSWVGSSLSLRETAPLTTESRRQGSGGEKPKFSLSKEMKRTSSFNNTGSTALPGHPARVSAMTVVGGNNCPQMIDIQFEPNVAYVGQDFTYTIYFSDLDQDIVSLSRTEIFPNGESRTNVFSVGPETNARGYARFTGAFAGSPGTMTVSAFVIDSRSCTSNSISRWMTILGQEGPPPPIPPPPVPPSRAVFNLSNLRVSPPEPTVNQSFTIYVTVCNNGSTYGSKDVVVRIDGTVAATEETVDIDAGYCRDGTFTGSVDSPGTHTISVSTPDDSASISINVRGAATPSIPEYIELRGTVQSRGWNGRFPAIFVKVEEILRTTPPGIMTLLGQTLEAMIQTPDYLGYVPCTNMPVARVDEVMVGDRVEVAGSPQDHDGNGTLDFAIMCAPDRLILVERPTAANQPPVADFTWFPSNPKVGDVVQFQDRSYDPDGYITSWSWNFGDGQTSGERNPSHSFTSAGTYTICLTVSDNAGLTSVQACQTIYVIRAAPANPGGWEIRNVRINANGTSVEVEPGATITVEFDYQLWNADNCPGCVRQLMVAIGNNADSCVYNSGPGTWPGYQSYASVTLRAPTSQGTYSLKAAVDLSPTGCQGAISNFANGRAAAGEKVIGTVVVKAVSINPGGFEVTNVRLNGNGTSVQVPPGANVIVEFDYRLWNADNCPGCVRQLILGLENQANVCVTNQNPGIWPGFSSHTSQTIQAPDAPGTYSVMVVDDVSPNGCSGAMANYSSKQGKKIIGTITVQQATPTDNPPVVTITSPSNGATISGQVTISVSFSDDIGLARYEIVVNGTVFSSDRLDRSGTLTTGSKSIGWDTTAKNSTGTPRYPDGSYTISAVVYDSSGQNTSSTITVRIQNRATTQPVDIAKYDTNKNCVIETDEFMRVLDDFMAGLISEQDFFKLQDYWVSGRQLEGCDEVQGTNVQITGVTISPDKPIVGQEATLKITLTNKGSTLAPEASYRFTFSFLDVAATGNDSLSVTWGLKPSFQIDSFDRSVNLPSLKQGESQIAMVPFTVLDNLGPSITFTDKIHIRMTSSNTQGSSEFDYYPPRFTYDINVDISCLITAITTRIYAHVKAGGAHAEALKQALLVAKIDFIVTRMIRTLSKRDPQGFHMALLELWAVTVQELQKYAERDRIGVLADWVGIWIFIQGSWNCGKIISDLFGAINALIRSVFANPNQPQLPTGTTISNFAYKDKVFDKVGSVRNPNPDGTPDGHFTITLELGTTMTIKSIILQTSDDKGIPQPVGFPPWVQSWTSDPSNPNVWILGVYKNGVRLNPTGMEKTIDTASGFVTYDLFANDSGYFKAGQYYRVEVRFEDGNTLSATTSIQSTSSGLKSYVESNLNTLTISPMTVFGMQSTQIRLEIYTSDGQRVLDTGFIATKKISWQTQQTRKRLANGVYLYVVTVRDKNDIIIGREIGKLIAIR